MSPVKLPHHRSVRKVLPINQKWTKLASFPEGIKSVIAANNEFIVTTVGDEHIFKYNIDSNEFSKSMHNPTIGYDEENVWFNEETQELYLHQYP